MAPRNKSLAPRNQVQDEAAEDSSPQEEIVTEPEVDAEEAWAAASRMEGYTPLTDTRTNGAVFMAFNPRRGEEENEETTFSGAFFADMSAFGPSSIDETDLQWDEQASGGGGVGENEAIEQNDDYRSAAEQALQALDEEYSMTQSGLVASASSSMVHENSSSCVSPSLSLPPTQSTTDSSETKAVKKKDVPEIDTDAVRKAVDAIRLKAPRLTSDLNKWEEQHGVTNTSTMALAPRDHSIIPKTPLIAFWRQSTRAIHATANLSRSATLAEAIVRLSCLTAGHDSTKASERLVIDIVGADYHECSSNDQLRITFGPLVRWIGALQNSPRFIELRLVGPNVPTEAAKRPPLNLMPSNRASNRRLQSATATCHEGLYHEWTNSEEKKQGKDFCPDLAIAFNSGIWGYNEWILSLEALCKSTWTVPFVSTAYTIEECQDDAEVIENVVSSSSTSKADDVVHHRCIWKSEANPFSSRRIRETATATSGREYRENAAWQAWRLGGSNT